MAANDFSGRAFQLMAGLVLAGLLSIFLSNSHVWAQSLAKKVEVLEACYKQNPDLKSGKALARALLESGKKADALKLTESLADKHGADAEAHFLWAESLFRSGKSTESAIEFKRAFNLDNTKFQYAVRAGEALQAAKRFDELAEFSLQALSKNPDPASRLTLEWLLRCAQERDSGIVKSAKAKGAA